MIPRLNGAALPLVAAAAILAGVLPARGERWQLQYFYDEAKSSLTLNDIHFVSPARGVAVGFISEGKQTKPTAVITSDGGAHWTLVPTREVGLSLFFRSESLGWMVTPKGLWRTTEAGRDWRKLPRAPEGLLRVYFLSDQHGFGVGMKNGVYETEDGGEHWKRAIDAPAKHASELNQYAWVDFVSPKSGVILGWTAPEHEPEGSLPPWIDPGAALLRAGRTHTLLSLVTDDAGKTWKPSAATGNGRATRIRANRSGRALELVEFGGATASPATVVMVDFSKGTNQRVYRNEGTAITDVWVTPAGHGYLAGFETAGRLQTAVPGKLRILRSDDLVKWTPMNVDYRAVASRVILSGADEHNIWAATDTGMILRLTQ